MLNAGIHPSCLSRKELSGPWMNQNNLWLHPWESCPYRWVPVCHTLTIFLCSASWQIFLNVIHYDIVRYHNWQSGILICTLPHWTLLWSIDSSDSLRCWAQYRSGIQWCVNSVAYYSYLSASITDGKVLVLMPLNLYPGPHHTTFWLGFWLGQILIFIFRTVAPSCPGHFSLKTK